MSPKAMLYLSSVCLSIYLFVYLSFFFFLFLLICNLTIKPSLALEKKNQRFLFPGLIFKTWSERVFSTETN